MVPGRPWYGRPRRTRTWSPGASTRPLWNIDAGWPAEAGILDYDLAYFDDSDLSWDAEDAVIQAGNEIFADLPAPVQIRDQARVHL